MINLILHSLVLLNVQQLDIISARTTLHLWHDLYVEKQIAYDFQHIFQPEFFQSEKYVFIGGIVSDEIKAIGLCKSNKKKLSLHTIAHAPHNEDMGDAFIQLLANEECDSFPVSIENALSVTQPRWFVAYNYYFG
jgi:hypothetical protein